MSKVQRLLCPAVGMLLVAGCSERTAMTAAPFAVPVKPLDEAASAQRRQALRKEVLRNPRHGAVEVVEAKLATQELAQDERRPAFGEDLRAHRDGTELAIEGHGATIGASRAGGTFTI